MSNTLFRKKSMERISSPEQLNDYIRVSTPSVWMLLAAIVILLAGVCVWGVVGHLDTHLTAAAVSRDGNVVAYIKEADIGKISQGMEVAIGGEKGCVASVAAEPVMVDETFSDYLLYVGALEIGGWAYEAALDVECADGVHEVTITTESISPMSFVLN